MPLPPLPPCCCPVCRRPLRPAGAGEAVPAGPWCARAGHSFDAARQGYFNLLVGKGTVFEADTADMVAARFDFLDAGHYRPLADAVAGRRRSPCSAAGAPSHRAGLRHRHGPLPPGRAGRRPAAPAATVTAVGLDISKFACGARPGSTPKP